MTVKGESLLARAAEEVSRLDTAFAAQHPDLVEALRTLMTEMVARNR